MTPRGCVKELCAEFPLLLGGADVVDRFVLFGVPSSADAGT